MNEGSWEECIETSSSISVTPDRAKAKSLIETANERIRFLKETDLKESNASFIFEGYYSSALETLHALVLMKGFKVINHICLGYYLRDVLKREDLSRLFDDCRYKRNSIVYYGRKLDFNVAKESIKKADRLIEQIRLLLERELK